MIICCSVKFRMKMRIVEVRRVKGRLDFKLGLDDGFGGGVGGVVFIMLLYDIGFWVIFNIGNVGGMY